MTSLVKSNKSTFDLLLIVFFHLTASENTDWFSFYFNVNQWCAEVLSLSRTAILAVISDPNNISNQEFFYILNL